MPDFAVKVISPGQFTGVGEVGPFPTDMFDRKYLAQGDSWFSIGSIPPGLTSNILDNLVASKSAFVVNCAFPGAKLSRMTDTTTNVQFLRLLTGRMALRWDAILLSGGGNDLIDAAGSDPGQQPHLRLLATPQERGAGPLQPDDYISKPGWKTFADHLTLVFDRLVQARDRDKNRRVPLVFHTYAPLMPRPAPAGLGFGPWLAPSLASFSVPQADWLGVATALIDRLAALLQSIVAAHTAADPNCALHLADTRTAGLAMAQPGSTGVSGDFQNEIHLTNGGYRKVGAVLRQILDVLPAQGG
jgi:hypothetical protein